MDNEEHSRCRFEKNVIAGALIAQWGWEPSMTQANHGRSQRSLSKKGSSVGAQKREEKSR